MKKNSFGFVPTLIELLRQNPATGGLMPAAERLMLLQQDLHPLLPPGTERACDIYVSDGEILVLNVETPALAGKLRQKLPSIKSGLEKRGWKVNAIQLRVQPLKLPGNSGSYLDAAAKPKQARLSDEGVHSWADLAAALDESPLQQAVARLVSRHRKKPGQE